MSTYFVTRHPGAREWARAQGLHIDRSLEHLDPAEVQAGDTVIGSLPVALAAAVCARGARYLHLTLDLPATLRGRELDAATLTGCGARLEPYEVRALAAGQHDVLVLPRAALPPLPQAAAWPWTTAGLPRPCWMPRAQAEQDEDYLQLVPYLLLLDVADQVWCYRRSGGDARVLGRLSCGVGGHVERCDDVPGEPVATLARTLRRELREELGPDADAIELPAPAAWLYEHESAIGRVHLGVIHVARWPHARPPQPVEPALEAEGFRPLAGLAVDPDCELWSRLAAGFVAGRLAVPGAAR